MRPADRLRSPPSLVLALAAAALLGACPGDIAPAGGHDGHDQEAHGDHGDDRGGDHDEHADEVHLSEEGVRSAGIRVERASRATLRPTFTAPARVEQDLAAVAHVGVQLAGRVREVRVRRGDRVAKGDVVLVVESPELGDRQVDFLTARDAAAQAEAPVDLAKRLLARAREAHESSRSLPLSTVEERERDVLGAENALAAAKAAASAAENRLHVLGMSQEEVGDLARTREVRTLVEVRAPFGGEVLERDVTLGEVVGPERDALLEIADRSAVQVVADVPEARVGSLTRGVRAVVRRPGADEPIEATVRYVRSSVDPHSRTLKVDLDVAQGGQGLVPGMFLEAELPLGIATAPVVAVPAAAVQTVEGGPAVFVPVEGEPGAFEKRAVVTGTAVDGLVEVREGLAEGEPFVAAGAFLLKAELGKASAHHEH